MKSRDLTFLLGNSWDLPQVQNKWAEHSGILTLLEESTGFERCPVFYWITLARVFPYPSGSGCSENRGFLLRLCPTVTFSEYLVTASSGLRGMNSLTPQCGLEYSYTVPKARFNLHIICSQSEYRSLEKTETWKKCLLLAAYKWSTRESVEKYRPLENIDLPNILQHLYNSFLKHTDWLD